MKTNIFISVLAFIVASYLHADEPTLPQKDIRPEPAVAEYTLYKPAGVRAVKTDTLFKPTGDYTVEIKARFLSTAVKGFFIETRDGARKGIRVALNSNGVFDYSKLNYTNDSAVVALSTEQNTTGAYHVFRFAVSGTDVHIYRNGTYLTSTTLQSIYNDNLMKDANGGFESEEMGNWSFVLAGQGRTTSEGEYRSGTAGVKLVNTDNSTVIASAVLKGLKPSTRYALSMYAKYLSKSANNGNMRFDLKTGYFDSIGTFVRTNAIDAYNNLYGSPTNSTAAASAVWTVNTKSFTTGAADSVVVLDFLGWNGTNTYVVDDIVLYEVEVSPAIGAAVGSNLVTNGDFTTNSAGWTNGGWPLGAVAWSATDGGQLQIKEASWVASSNGTYTQNIAVTPGKTYKLSAKTSHRAAAASPLFRSVRLVDGAASVSADYSVPTAGLTTYYNNTTPALTAGPASTSLAMQFTTKTNSSTGSPVVVMTLDDVVLQEYDVTFPSYLNYGKMYQSDTTHVEVSYIAYDLSGAFAPGSLTTATEEIVKPVMYYSAGKLVVTSAAATQLKVVNLAGSLVGNYTVAGAVELPVNLNSGVYIASMGQYRLKFVVH